MAPTADGRTPALLLRRAAEVLSHMAHDAAQGEEPVTCPLCVTPAASLQASPNGHTVLGPCGHALP